MCASGSGGRGVLRECGRGLRRANAWEWAADWGGDYRSGAVTNPKGPSGGSNRVRRGGARPAAAPSTSASACCEITLGSGTHLRRYRAPERMRSRKCATARGVPQPSRGSPVLWPRARSAPRARRVGTEAAASLAAASAARCDPRPAWCRRCPGRGTARRRAARRTPRAAACGVTARVLYVTLIRSDVAALNRITPSRIGREHDLIRLRPRSRRSTAGGGWRLDFAGGPGGPGERRG